MGSDDDSIDDVREGVRSSYSRLWRYCLALTSRSDLASDLAQATCLRALEKRSSYDGRGRLDGWLFRIAQRIWYNEQRSKAVRRGGGLVPIEEADLPDGRPSPEANILAREVLLEVMGLPEAQRVTVVLVYVEGYSYKEAAEILEIPIGTIMSRLAAARMKLAAKFEGQESKAG